MILTLPKQRQEPSSRLDTHRVLDTLRKTWCPRTSIAQALGDMTTHQSPLRWGWSPHSSPGSGRTRWGPSRPTPATGQRWAFRAHCNCLLVFGKHHSEGCGWISFDIGGNTCYEGEVRESPGRGALSAGATPSLPCSGQPTHLLNSQSTGSCE